MMKNIHTLLIAMALCVAMPFSAIAVPMIEIVEFTDLDPQSVTISVEQNVIHVSGASGQTMYIYNVAGVCVSTIKVDGDDKHIDTNLPKGCYIVKVGKIVRKISIR